MKIICLQSHAIQYFSPLFKAISESNFCDFKVYYCSDSSVKGYLDKGFGKNVKWDIPLLEGYEYVFLKNYSFKPGTNLKFYNLVNPGIFKVIFKEKPDVVWVHGWAYLTIWFAIIACKLSGTKIWMKCESPLNQELRKSKLNKVFKRIFLRHFLFKLIDKFLYIGQENKDFYLYHQVSPEKLVFSPYAVDNDRFQKMHQDLCLQKNSLKDKLGFPINSTVVLFSGKLIEKKRPWDLLKAFAQLNYPELFLIFVGDGELRKPMEEFILSNKLKSVFITGFINQHEIPKYYTIADIFVLPSTAGETWGLVVNEAMNFKLPVVVSDVIGCTKDLVEDGVNGFSYSMGNIEQLKNCIQKLIESTRVRSEFGRRSFEKIEHYSYAVTVNNMKQICKSA